MAGELRSAQSEHAELQQRLNHFVRESIDHMLAYRMLKDRSATAEGARRAGRHVLGRRLSGSR